jgi:phenol 2-monooxygenase
VQKYRRQDEDIDAVIDLRAIFQQGFDVLLDQKMPAILKPLTGRLGLQDHEKVFCVDHKGAGDIFAMRGVDRDLGCMVVVRPDQYIAHVLPLDAHQALANFFDGVFLSASA